MEDDVMAETIVQKMMREEAEHVEQYAAAFWKMYPDVDPTKVELQVHRDPNVAGMHTTYRIVKFDDSVLSRQLLQARELSEANYAEALELRKERDQLRVTIEALKLRVHKHLQFLAQAFAVSGKPIGE